MVVGPKHFLLKKWFKVMLWDESLYFFVKSLYFTRSLITVREMLAGCKKFVEFETVVFLGNKQGDLSL